MSYLIQMIKVAISDTMLQLAKERKSKEVKMACELYAVLLARVEEIKAEEEALLADELELEMEIDEITEIEAMRILGEKAEEKKAKKKSSKKGGKK